MSGSPARRDLGATVLPGATDAVPSIGVPVGPDLVHVVAATAPAGDDAAKIDQIRYLENLKSACAAAQARVTAAFARSQRARRPAPSARVADGIPGTPGDPAGAPARHSSARRLAAARRAAARRVAERSSAAEVALARRESPHRGGRYVGLAEALVDEMPHTLDALGSGVINEWRAALIVRETACLTEEQRTSVDAEIAGRLDGLGDARIVALVRQIAYRIDPGAATRRASRAVSDRRVSLRPAADAMAYLTQLLPVAAAVACYAELGRTADAHPGGDGRTRSQRMADEAVTRLMASGVSPSSGSRPAEGSGSRPAEGSGSRPADGCAPGRSGDGSVPADPVNAVREAYQRSGGAPVGESPRAGDAVADRAEPPGAPRSPGADAPFHDPHGFPPGAGVMINLVISDRSLLCDGDDPALLDGRHVIPAPLARKMIAGLPPGASAWIRRLYRRPGVGDLVSMDARRRTFSPLLRQLLFTRDQGTCRTPWCSAPARHADHLQPFAEGGGTSLENGQSLSEDCNYARTAPGWSARHDPERPADILVTTPTGHTYRSPAPDVIPARRPKLRDGPGHV